jgi:glutamate-ammonia-ligase adenylyltransferase
MTVSETGYERDVIGMAPLHRLPDILAADLETKLDRLSQSLNEAGLSIPTNLYSDPQFRQVLAFSDFVADSCIADPRLLAGLWDSGDLQRALAPGECASRLAAALAGADQLEDLSGRLRRFRRWAMVRIAWRDLTNAADLAATTSDLSDLAEACLDQALAWLYSRQCAEQGTPLRADGRPMELVVLALGKLGARELNFSSDIDLIFSYPANGDTQGTSRPVTHEEFFGRLCRQLMALIGHATPEGIVFRVDLRLRPFGEGGPVVLSFDAM